MNIYPPEAERIMEYHLILLFALCPIRYAFPVRNPSGAQAPMAPPASGS